jgi:hypothetical protein
MVDTWSWLLAMYNNANGWRFDGDPGVTASKNDSYEAVVARCAAAGWQHVPVDNVDQHRAIHLFRRPVDPVTAVAGAPGVADGAVNVLELDRSEMWAYRDVTLGV